jgi:hypothetical protein
MKKREVIPGNPVPENRAKTWRKTDRNRNAKNHIKNEEKKRKSERMIANEKRQHKSRRDDCTNEGEGQNFRPSGDI